MVGQLVHLFRPLGERKSENAEEILKWAWCSATEQPGDSLIASVNVLGSSQGTSNPRQVCKGPLDSEGLLEEQGLEHLKCQLRIVQS